MARKKWTRINLLLTIPMKLPPGLVSQQRINKLSLFGPVRRDSRKGTYFELGKTTLLSVLGQDVDWLLGQ